MHQLCQGVGLNDRKYPSRSGNKTAKEDYLKEIAEEYKDVLDSRVYNYLLNHKIEITD